MELSRQKYWNGLPCPPLGELPDPGIEPKSPTLQVDSLPTEPPRKPRGPIPTFIAFSSVQSLSRVQLIATPWTVARQASLSITNSWSLLKLMFTQTQVSDAIQPFHPLSFLSPPAFNLSQHQGLFQ